MCVIYIYIACLLVFFYLYIYICIFIVHIHYIYILYFVCSMSMTFLDLWILTHLDDCAVVSSQDWNLHHATFSGEVLLHHGYSPDEHGAKKTPPWENKLTAETRKSSPSLRRNIIWTKPPWLCSMLIFRGAVSDLIQIIESISRIVEDGSPVWAARLQNTKGSID